ncbi:MAG: hypothetical protein ACI9WM_000208 [Arenicella sp.]|jgi:hypothetical protein
MCCQNFLFAQYCGNESNFDLTALAHRNANLITYEVPIVIHILYSDSNSYVSDFAIYQGINTLNSTFGSINLDSPNAETFKFNLANPNIRFVLAENRIYRVRTAVKSFNLGNSLFTIDHPKYSRYGGADAWDTDN